MKELQKCLGCYTQVMDPSENCLDSHLNDGPSFEMLSKVHVGPLSCPSTNALMMSSGLELSSTSISSGSIGGIEGHLCVAHLISGWEGLGPVDHRCPRKLRSN